MDVGLSAKPQTLSLVSCTSQSPLHCSLYPSRVRSFRREFLGCGHNLRPPGLRSQRKCRKLGFHIQSPRFILRASLDSQSILIVIAVITVSAITVFYLNPSKRKKKIKEIVNPKGLQSETSVKESEDDLMKMKETSHAFVDKVAELQMEEMALVHEEALLATTIQTHGSNIIASSVNDSISFREPDVTGLSSRPPPVLSGPGAFQPIDFVTNMPELAFEGREPKSQFDLDLHNVMVREKINGEVDELKEPSAEFGEESEVMSYSGSFRESGREELYKFYEGNQSLRISAAKFNGQTTLSTDASSQGSSRFSSLIRSSTTKGAKLMAPDFHQTADRTLAHSKKFEVNVPIGLYREGSLHEGKGVGKSRGFFQDEEKRTMSRNGYKTLCPSFYSNELHVRRYPSQQLNTYNRLLRDGRLTDCIKLLEDMERKGLLDMDKVYHARFFKTCKSQKAVKEAFDFCKLIPNPTPSTFNMLMSVCASSQDSEGAFQVLQLVEEAGMKADCKLYTTLISTCAKSGKVDTVFKVFHEMVNAEVEPNGHTYGALIDGCAKAGQVAKAFGAYGIMRSKNVKPDRVIFNALITACGQSGAVDRAFDVLAEMRAETQPIDPDHVTIGALIKACANAGQVNRAREVYNMIDEYNIKGTPELYTIAVNSCSQAGDWEFACCVYNDMTRKAVVPDEMFLSALIDVAGHARKLDDAFEVIQKSRNQGMDVGIISYSSLMGACSNAKNWQKALELYEDIKSIELKPTVSTMNALINALCDGEQLSKAVDILSEMKRAGLRPNTITYSILLTATEKKDDLEVGLMLLSQAKKDGVAPNLVMCRCLIDMCLRRFEKARTLGEPLLSFNSGRPQIDSKWTSLALMVYRETIAAGVIPTTEEVSKVLGCLQLPHDSSIKERLIENLGVSADASVRSNLCSLLEGFGEYDPRAFSLLEEAASLGLVPCVSFKDSPVVVDARELQFHIAEVYLLTVLKGLKNRLAAGARLPNINILLPVEKTQIQSSTAEKSINLAGRISQAVAALLRRLGLAYLGNESYGKIRINGVVVKKWFKPKLASPFIGKPIELSSSMSRLGKGISKQQRHIRTGNLSLD